MLAVYVCIMKRELENIELEVPSKYFKVEKWVQKINQCRLPVFVCQFCHDLTLGEGTNSSDYDKDILCCSKCSLYCHDCDEWFTENLEDQHQNCKQAEGRLLTSLEMFSGAALEKELQDFQYKTPLPKVSVLMDWWPSEHHPFLDLDQFVTLTKTNCCGVYIESGNPITGTIHEFETSFQWNGDPVQHIFNEETFKEDSLGFSQENKIEKVRFSREKEEKNTTNRLKITRSHITSMFCERKKFPLQRVVVLSFCSSPQVFP